MEMKKLTKAVLIVALLPYLVTFGYSASQYIGQAIQPVSQSGTWSVGVTGSTVTLAAGTANIGNVGLSTGTNSIGNVGLNAGSNTIGKVDLNAGSNTIGNVNLNAGANTIGNVGIVGTVPLPTGAATEATLLNVEVGTDRIPAQGQATMAASLPVVVASNQSAIPVALQTSSSPVHVSATATTTSVQLLNANPNRKGLECESSCAGNKRTFLRLGTGPATSADKPLEACSAWEPPVVPTSQVHIVAETGSQAVTCIEY